MTERHLLFASLLAGLLAVPTAASAAPDGGTITGSIERRSADARKPYPALTRGFIKRQVGPLKTPRSYDPRREIIVVVEGATAPAEDMSAGSNRVRYELIGESFKTPVVGVVVGAPIEVKNLGHTAPVLYVSGRDDFVEASPINPKGLRKLAKLAKPFETVVLRAKEASHLRGRIVAIPHPYFALVDGSGNYTIKGVPAGSYKVRMWYRDGWLGQPVSVTVSAKKTTKAAKLTLPAQLTTTPPGGN